MDYNKNKLEDKYWQELKKKEDQQRKVKWWAL